MNGTTIADYDVMLPPEDPDDHLIPLESDFGRLHINTSNNHHPSLPPPLSQHYQKSSTAAAGGGPPPSVRPRNKNNKMSIKERLQNVVSIYIPPSSTGGAGAGSANGDDGGKVLLNFDATEMETLPQRGGGGTITETCTDDYHVQLVGSVGSLFDGADGSTICCCSMTRDSRHLIVAFQNSPAIYKVDVTSNELKLVHCWTAMHQDSPIYPSQVQCTDQAVFVSGKCTINGQVQFLIVKMTLDNQKICHTRKYGFEKFGQFEVDLDGNLILLSPQLDEGDSGLSQVCKLSQGFEKRIYFINLGKLEAKYEPQHVSCHGPGLRTWVSLLRTPKDSSEELPPLDNQNESVVVKEMAASTNSWRLLSFTCCHSPLSTQSLRDQLGVELWNMSGIEPKEIASLGDKLLVLDAVDRNLCEVSWDHINKHPTVTKLSKPGNPIFTGLCSNGTSDAYLFTAKSIFKFTYRTEEFSRSDQIC